MLVALLFGDAFDTALAHVSAQAIAERMAGFERCHSVARFGDPWHEHRLVVVSQTSQRHHRQLDVLRAATYQRDRAVRNFASKFDVPRGVAVGNHTQLPPFPLNSASPCLAASFTASR